MRKALYSRVYDSNVTFRITHMFNENNLEHFIICEASLQNGPYVAEIENA